MMKDNGKEEDRIYYLNCFRVIRRFVKQSNEASQFTATLFVQMLKCSISIRPNMVEAIVMYIHITNVLIIQNSIC